MEIPTAVTIYYYRELPCAVVFNGVVLWDSGIVETKLNEGGEDFMQIDVTVPWTVAINFCITFCQGTSVELLKKVTETIKKRTAELVEIETRNLKVDTNIDLNW